MIRLFHVYYPIRTLILLLGEALIVWTSFLVAAVMAVASGLAWLLVDPSRELAVAPEAATVPVATVR